jgi:hypothetical protein
LTSVLFKVLAVEFSKITAFLDWDSGRNKVTYAVSMAGLPTDVRHAPRRNYVDCSIHLVSLLLAVCFEFAYGNTPPIGCLVPTTISDHQVVFL